MGLVRRDLERCHVRARAWGDDDGLSGAMMPSKYVGCWCCGIVRSIWSRRITLPRVSDGF